MQFNVTFRTESKRLFISPPGEIALDILDLIREDVAPLEVSSEEVINGSCPSSLSASNITFTLSEERARETGLFSAKTDVEIIVPSYSLSKFVEHKMEIEYYSRQTKFTWFETHIKRKTISKKEICRIYINYEIDGVALVSAWIEAGSPLKWDPIKNIEWIEKEEDNQKT